MPQATTSPTIRSGAINWLGLWTLARRETQRFLAVWTQTLAAPLVTAGLFLSVFTLAVGPARGTVFGVPFVEFLAPGILMMAVIQNAFANTSSSLVIAKIQGNIVDTLMPPLSAGEITAGYVAGGTVRGVMVAGAIGIALWALPGFGLAHPLWAAAFILMGAILMSLIGLVAGIYANKFDQMAAITNFIIVPLSFLSGTFYSIDNLPPLMQTLSRFNPIFYLIDGLRYGMIGQSDSAPALGAAICGITIVIMAALCRHLLKIGYRLKN